MQTDSTFRLLLPVATLPDEAANWSAPPPVDETPNARLSWLISQLAGVTLGEIPATQDVPDLPMAVVRLCRDIGGTPRFDVEEDVVSIAVAADTLHDTPIAEASDDVWRALATQLRDVIAAAWREPADRIIVLLDRSGSDTIGTVRFLGAVLRPESGESWEITGGHTLFIEPEVEGRGVRTAVTIVGFLLTVGHSLGSAAPRTSGHVPDAARTEQLTEATDSVLLDIAEAPEPTRIVVTSQELTQAPPLMNEQLLTNLAARSVRIVVDVGAQRAYLLVDDQVAIETPVSTARAGKVTPRGTFRITQKVERNKFSTIYGVELPYWMRLDGSDIGFHVGRLPGQPASAGCIRLPEEVAKLFFQHAAAGTTVQVVDSWAR